MGEEILNEEKDCVQLFYPNYRTRPDENRRFLNMLKFFYHQASFKKELTCYTHNSHVATSRSTLGLYLEQVYQGLKRAPLLPYTRSPSPYFTNHGYPPFIFFPFRCFLYQIDVLRICIQPGNRIIRKGPQISILRTILVLYRAAVNYPYKLFELGRWRIIAIYATLYILGKTRARLSIVCLPEKEKKGKWNSALSSRFFFFFFFKLLLKKDGTGEEERAKKGSHVIYVEGNDVREKSTGAGKTEIAFCRVHTGRSAREIRICTRGWHTALNDGRNKSGVFSLLFEVERANAFSFCRLGVAAAWSNPMPTIKLREKSGLIILF